MRLGLSIEYDGKSYDILELPTEAFTQLIPGLSKEQLSNLERRFQQYWPDPTRCRHHILGFVGEQLGASIDYVLLMHETVRFNDKDIEEYIEEHVHEGRRPN
ncbi:hypothetical protein [Alicyclobacillus ferrooxydans]|uniref:Uncharacterized protein n=1 Tax=Alicyclobacillus ferrooxydans TaxID=471514 RepID=A0A0P9CGP2_9BACL|nr:hypothetical protein [Alicyclobacillus ferrooxydans]KPV44902.1 hypothetical protein AN477_04600 [Alicyclobacillus ferrooxydans]